MIEILVGILALLAGGFAVVAAMGVLRFPDALSRMHASSKVGSFAGALALLAAAFWFGQAGPVLRAVLAAGFVLLTAPIGAHLLGRAGAWRAARLDPPPGSGE